MELGASAGGILGSCTLVLNLECIPLFRAQWVSLSLLNLDPYLAEYHLVVSQHLVSCCTTHLASASWK